MSLRAAALRSARVRRAAARRSAAAVWRTTGSREVPTHSVGRRWSTCNPGWTWTSKVRRKGGTAAGCMRTRAGGHAVQACDRIGQGVLLASTLTCTAPVLLLLKKPPPLDRVAKLGRDAATFSVAGASVEPLGCSSAAAMPATVELSSAKGAPPCRASACMGLGAESNSGPGPTASSCAGSSNVEGE